MDISRTPRQSAAIPMGKITEEAMIEQIAYFMNLDKSKINLDSRLREDLQINSRDANEFFRVFSLRYGVDISGFEIDQYFDSGSSMVRFVTSLMGGKDQKSSLKSLRIRDLLDAVEQQVMPPKAGS